MALITNEGLNDLLSIALGIGSTLTMALRLFVNSYTIIPATVLGDLTECTIAGYACVTLSTGSWVPSALSNTWVYDYPQVTYTFTSNSGPSTVYGWYMVDTTSSKLVCGGNISPYTPDASLGGSLGVTIKITDA